MNENPFPGILKISIVTIVLTQTSILIIVSLHSTSGNTLSAPDTVNNFFSWIYCISNKTYSRWVFKVLDQMQIFSCGGRDWGNILIQQEVHYLKDIFSLVKCYLFKFM